MAEDRIILERQAKRLRFLNKLYDLTDGDPLKFAHCIDDVGQAIGIRSQDEVLQILGYLRGERLLEDRTAVGHVALTHHGVKEIEQARAGSNRPTRHFPSAVVYNVFHNSGTITGSMIQQAGDGAQQTDRRGEP